MRFNSISIITLTLAIAVTPLAAQQDRPARGERQQSAPRMEPDQAKAAWELQALGVSKSLGLAEDATTRLIETYLVARKDHGEAMAKFRRGARAGGPREGRPGAGEGQRRPGDGERPGRPEAGERPGRPEAGERPGGGEGRGAGRGAGGPEGRGAGRGAARGSEQQQKQRELTEVHRKKLAESLGAYLSGETLEGAVVALGTFDPGWDRMVNTVAGFDLGKEKTLLALGPIQTYVVELARTRDSDDRRGSRESMRTAREKLSTTLKSMLTDGQMRRFERAMGGQRGARGGGFAARLLEADANGDGMISREEMPERMAPMFDRLDANGDGMIDKTEMEAAGQRRGGAGRRGPGGDDF